MILVLLGSHGAGKTTLGKVLAERFGVDFHPELGREMAEDPSWRETGLTAADPDCQFDRELFGRELSRDAESFGISRIVETWHPGNLAYAAHRSPAETSRWLAAIRWQCSQTPALALPLFASRATLLERQSEPGDIDFFREIGRSARRWAQQLGLICLPRLCTDHRSPQMLAEVVVSRLDGTLTPTRQPRRS